MTKPIPLAGFTVVPMTFAGATRDVYRTGVGPGVIVMHEILGITPEVARFARKVAEAGFTVYMPIPVRHSARPITTT